MLYLYKQYQNYLTTDTYNLEEIVYSENFTECINKIQELISRKKNNVSSQFTITDFGKSLDYINEYIVDFFKIINTNKSLIDIINRRKNNLQNERLELNRKIILSKVNITKIDLNDKAKEIGKLNESISLLIEDIRVKEESEKIDKKLKVTESFKYFLNIFFLNKYSFDEDSFCIKFQNNLLSDNATDVLSEGEKSIVAFCYYLSDIHAIVNSTNDYEKLFLVVDDPISSLDFHYVYSVSQIIRNFGRTYGIQRTRFFILTHNLEFMSILIRNKIINHRYVLSHKGIGVLRRELVMPYEEHLKDIYEISVGRKLPNHTTSNSIRHILETINRFISPDIELQSFCQNIETFDECEFLYTLIQDNSHGSIRIQKAHTDESIIRACEIVIDYISMNLRGQLKNLV